MEDEDEKESIGPALHLVDGSELEASIDPSGIDIDGICRPLFIQQEADCLNLTVADARRLLDFLTEAIPYMEEKVWEH